MRFRLKAGAAPERLPRLVLAVTRPLVHEFEVFAPVKGGAIRRLQAGFLYYSTGRDLGHRIRALLLPHDLAFGPEVYVRVRSNVACYGLALYGERAFDRYSRFEYLFFGLVTGVMAAMLLYNLVIALFLRDRVYAAYCAYFAAMLGYTALLSGWPLGLGLPPAVFEAGVLKLFAVMYFFAALFSRSFLGTKVRHPLGDRILLVLMALSLLNLTLSTIGYFNLANTMAYGMALLGPMVMIAVAARVWCSGYQPARYYLAAWSLLFLGTAVYAASGLGLLEYSFMVYTAPCMGAAAESVVLSLALADRIRSLREERTALREQERRLTELSITDELTGLYNKRWFSSKLVSEMDHAHRLARPLSLLVADVDHFKQFNNTYGHAAGDEVLARLGRTIAETMRPSDVCCRYGGEEFAIIMPGADLTPAVTAAERLRKRFAQCRINVATQGQASATISLGAALMNRDDDDEMLFRRADQALYRAKEQGRDRVVAQ